jgi:hypothetical protein
MNQPTQPTYADTRQGRQMKAALAIAKLSEHQLPEIYAWRIEPDGSIDGMLRYSGDVDDALAAWSLFLGHGDAIPAPVVVAYSTGAGCVEIRSTYRHVAIRIWYGIGREDVARLTAPGGES